MQTTLNGKPVTMNGLVEKEGNGLCYMQNSDEGPFKKTEGDSYCPDYINRKYVKEKPIWQQ